MSRSVSGESPVRVRFAFLWALAGAAALAGSAWGVSQYQISDLKQRVGKAEDTRKIDRELLVRIDERTEQMKKDQEKILNRLYPPLAVADSGK